MEHILNCAAPLCLPLCLHVHYDFSSSFPVDCETVAREAARTSLSNSVDMTQSSYLHIVYKQSFLG